jgi:hypothetical protein
MTYDWRRYRAPHGGYYGLTVFQLGSVVAAIYAAIRS